MAQMVADVLIGVLEQIGVRQIFGLIGDSLNPLGDAVRRGKIEWIGVRHEEGAALAAAGQAKLRRFISLQMARSRSHKEHRSISVLRLKQTVSNSARGKLVAQRIEADYSA